MKKILFLLMLVLCYACEEDKSVDPTLMPPATTTGENIVGCLIDGWVYTSGRFGDPKITTDSDEENFYVEICCKVGPINELSILLVNPQQGATCTYKNTWFGGEDLPDGEAYITRMDGKVISGTFSGGPITEGRFDLKYPKDSQGGETNYE